MDYDSAIYILSKAAKKFLSVIHEEAKCISDDEGNCVQWNLSYCGHLWESSNCPDCRIQEWFCTELQQIVPQLGQNQVSILEMCPYFRGVHSERFHCTCTHVYMVYTCSSL